MTPNQRLYEQEIRHQIGLRRLSETTIRRAIGIINKTIADLEERLTKIRLEEKTQSQALREIDKMLVELRRKQKEFIGQLEIVIENDLEKLALYEARFNTRNLRAVAGVGFNIPTEAAIVAAASSRPFQGRYLREWMKGLDTSTASRIRDQVRIGYLEGQSVEAIVRRIRGTKSRRFEDGIIEISRRDAGRIVRTAMTHTANSSSQIIYEAASDVMSGVRYVAILDNRTSLVCAGLDGKVFPVDKGPRPPQHHNCRSTTAAVIKGAPPFSRESYAEWLKRQPTSVQDEVLGPTRGKLFRNGLKIDRFTDRKGQAWDLDELERRENGIWMKAGLNDE